MIAARSIGQLGRVLDDLVDPALGVVRSVYEVAREPGSPDFFHFAARAANTAAFGFAENFANTGGASSDKAMAIAKACGEAIERYSAALYKPEELTFASARQLGPLAIRPSAFALHSADQYSEPGYPWAPFDEDAPVRWTPASRLRDGAIVQAPAAFVWIPYVFDATIGETPIGQPISTGLACHETPEQAMIGGLCETIERDAFTLFWQARMSPPQIRVETLSDANYDLVRRFESTGDTVRLLDLTTDIAVPVVLAVLCGRSRDRPAFVFAAACALDGEEAVRKALEELAHTRRYSEQCLRQMQCPSADNDFEDVEHQAHHLRLAADHDHSAAFSFVLASPRRIDFADLKGERLAPAQTLSRIVARLEEVGVDAYAADLTSSDVRGLGLCVLRVLAPGLHPLFMGHRGRARGGERLYTVPQSLGQTGLIPGQSDNPLPHPYP